MTYRYMNTTGEQFRCANFVFQAVAENEITSMFDEPEANATTYVCVIVTDNESGEQIAAIDYSAFFWFTEGYSYKSKQWGKDVFRFDLEQESIALAAHDWVETETTPEEVETLAGGWDSHFWTQANRAAESLCLSLESVIRDMRSEDLSETVDLPEYALPYIYNADPSGLSEEDIKNIDEWSASLDRQGFVRGIELKGQDTEEGPQSFFSRSPAFGLPAQCVTAFIRYVEDID